MTAHMSPSLSISSADPLPSREPFMQLILPVMKPCSLAYSLSAGKPTYRHSCAVLDAGRGGSVLSPRPENWTKRRYWRNFMTDGRVRQDCPGPPARCPSRGLPVRSHFSYRRNTSTLDRTPDRSLDIGENVHVKARICRPARRIRRPKASASRRLERAVGVLSHRDVVVDVHGPPAEAVGKKPDMNSGEVSQVPQAAPRCSSPPLPEGARPGGGRSGSSGSSCEGDGPLVRTHETAQQVDE